MCMFIIMICISIYFLISGNTKTWTWWTKDGMEKVNKYTAASVLGGLFMSIGFSLLK